jgi:hypothetical protein
MLQFTAADTGMITGPLDKTQSHPIIGGIAGAIRRPIGVPDADAPRHYLVNGRELRMYHKVLRTT